VTISIESPASRPDAAIPRHHAYDGEGDNVSPPLAWTGVPCEMQELALICDDPDAPPEEPWVHGVVYGLPATTSSLEEGSAGGARGRN
jgi:hypothetical protein